MCSIKTHFINSQAARKRRTGSLPTQPPRTKTSHCQSVLGRKHPERNNHAIAFLPPPLTSAVTLPTPQDWRERKGHTQPTPLREQASERRGKAQADNAYLSPPRLPLAEAPHPHPHHPAEPGRRGRRMVNGTRDRQHPAGQLRVPVPRPDALAALAALHRAIRPRRRHDQVPALRLRLRPGARGQPGRRYR